MPTTAVRLTGEKMAIFVAPVRRLRWERVAIAYNDANRRACLLPLFRRIR